MKIYSSQIRSKPRREKERITEGMTHLSAAARRGPAWERCGWPGHSKSYIGGAQERRNIIDHRAFKLEQN